MESTFIQFFCINYLFNSGARRLGTFTVLFYQFFGFVQSFITLCCYSLVPNQTGFHWVTYLQRKYEGRLPIESAWSGPQKLSDPKGVRLHSVFLALCIYYVPNSKLEKDKEIWIYKKFDLF